MEGKCGVKSCGVKIGGSLWSKGSDNWWKLRREVTAGGNQGGKWVNAHVVKGK